MRTSLLLLILASVVLILLSLPEESHGVVFVLTHGRVRDLQRKAHDRKKKRQKARRNRNRKKKQRQADRKKLKELKRWLARFSKKVSSKSGV